MTEIGRKIVYVGCRANVNRSFIAEQILLNYLRENPLPVEVRSGGVQVSEQACNMSFYPWILPTFTQALQKMGLAYIIPAISRHRSRPFTLPVIKEADLVLTMTKRQREHLRNFATPHTKVLMLSQLADLGREEDVFDAMLAPESTVEAFVYQIAMLQYFLDLRAFRARLGFA